MMRWPEEIFGVDFSGAARPSGNVWVAHAKAVRVARGKPGLRLVQAKSLEQLLGADPPRDVALAGLVELIRGSGQALWGIDFPFGLPVELKEMGEDWSEHLRFVSNWKGDAPEFGRWCIGQAKALKREMHIRRTTDTEVKTPFDCYHYRIVYQTFHGMRDVLAPLQGDATVAVLPFQYERLASAKRVVVEACPSSTLKRLALPFRNYKEPAASRISAGKRRTRLAILAGLEQFIAIDPASRKVLLSNPGGDALDAVIAAVGAHQSVTTADHDAIRRHPRYTREGFVYA